MTETQFGQKLKKKLEAKGWLWEKIPQGRFKGGFPDVVLIDPGGYVIFMELKVGRNICSKLQRLKLKAIDRHGAIAIVGRLDGEATFKTIQQDLEANSKSGALLYCEILKDIWEEK